MYTILLLPPLSSSSKHGRRRCRLLLYSISMVFPNNLSFMFFPRFVNMTKNTPLTPPSFVRFSTPLNDVCMYIAWSWKKKKKKKTLITWIILWGWYPTSKTSACPLPGVIFSLYVGQTGNFLIMHYIATNFGQKNPSALLGSKVLQRSN